MADAASSPHPADQPENPTPPSDQPDPPPSTSLPLNPNPNPNPNPNLVPPPPLTTLPPPPSIQLYAPPPQVPAVPPTAPSFRPATPPVPVPSATPQFSPLPPLNFQNPGVQPPGVSAPAPAPMMMQHYAGATVPGQPPQPNPAFRMYTPMPNGYPATQGTIPLQGMPRYPSPFAPMVRPTFPPRPPTAIGIVPPLLRPPVPGIRGPIMPPVFRPAGVPSVTPTDKPQTTVYVGKIATVENDFILPLLELCGPVKNWKRYQDPTTGAPKNFGICEFESAEGVLRALRLLCNLNVDGQELMINVADATTKYLEQFVEKKTESLKKLKETESEGAEKEEEGAPSAEKSEPPKPSGGDLKKDDKDSSNEETKDTASFGIVTDEDREADREALEKLTRMIEERLKNRPLPPPPLLPAADASGKSNSEEPARSRDGDSDVDMTRNAEDKNDDEMTSDIKPTSEHDKPETSSPDRSREHDRRSKEREKKEKERQLERYERERMQDRARRDRERDYKIKEDDRRYKARVKEWESREREKEYVRKVEKEKEKEKEYKRKREVMDQEDDIDGGDLKRRKHKSSSSEERRRRLREKEEDSEDRLKEEEEVAEAKRRAEEERLQQKQEEKDAAEIPPVHFIDGRDKALLRDESNVGAKDEPVEETYNGDYGGKTLSNSLYSLRPLLFVHFSIVVLLIESTNIVLP